MIQYFLIKHIQHLCLLKKTQTTEHSVVCVLYTLKANIFYF